MKIEKNSCGKYSMKSKSYTIESNTAGGIIIVNKENPVTMCQGFFTIMLE